MKAKRILSGFIAAATMFTVVAAPLGDSGFFKAGTAVVASAETYGDFTYTVKDDNTIRIDKYNGSATKVRVPATINGSVVNEIGNGAFRGRDASNKTVSQYNIVELSLPATIKKIASYAFYGLECLMTIELPEGLEYIGGYAFDTGSNFKMNLTDVDIPSTVTYVGSCAFDMDSCVAEKSGYYMDDWAIYLYSSPREGTRGLANSAGYNRCNVDGIIFPDSLEYIGDYCFESSFLKGKLIIPENVKNIGVGAFKNCDRLTEVFWIANHDIPRSCFYDSDGIKKVYVSTDVELGDTAFYSADSLVGVYVSGNVGSIGEQTFLGCTKLVNATFHGNNSVTIGASAFSVCSSLESLTLPAVTSVGSNAFNGCSYLQDVYLGCSETDFANATISTTGNDYFTGADYTYNHTKNTEGGFGVISAPDCITDGFNSEICSCGHVGAVLVEKLGHKYTDTVVAPTCVEQGCTIHLCSVCNYSFADTYTEITAHPFGEWEVTTAPTCTATGIDTATCTYCGETKTRITEMLPHSFTNYVSDGNATCLEDGTKTAKCDNCVATDTVTDEDSATGHSFTNYIYDGNATCLEDGTKTAKCDDCSATDTITAIGTATGHSFTNYIYDGNATCDKDGTKTAKCDHCSATDTVTAIGTATGHSFTYYVSDGNATCTKDGTKTAKCDDCSVTNTVADVGSMLPHTFTNYVSDNNAECGKDGTKTAKCDHCSATDTIIDEGTAKKHSYQSAIIKPTYTRNGYTEYTCSRCGHSYRKNYTDKLVLAPVTDFAIGGRAGNALRLNWKPNSEATGYIIEMYKDGSWTKIATINDSATTTYRVTGLAGGTKYTFRMKAFITQNDRTATSKYTSKLAGTTNPAAVKGLKVSAKTTTAIRIAWNKDTTASGYIIEQYKSGKWTRIAKITNNATTNYRVSGLKITSTYKFRVRAYKSADGIALYGAYSPTLTASTYASTVKGLKLGGKTSTAIRLNWTKNTAVDGYILERYDGSKWARVTKITKNTTVTYRNSGLTPNTSYQYRLCGYKKVGGVVYYSAYVTLTAKTDTSPIPAGLKQSSASSSSATIKWNAVSGATKYSVSIYKNGAWVTNNNVTATTYSLTGLSSNTKYQVKVRSYKNGTYSAFCNAIYVYTAPSAPKGLKKVDSTTTSIKVSWTSNSYADGYRVEIDRNGYWEGYDTTSTSYTFDSLFANTSYKVRVRAYKVIAGSRRYSPYSSELNAKTDEVQLTPYEKLYNYLVSEGTYKDGRYYKAIEFTDNGNVSRAEIAYDVYDDEYVLNMMFVAANGGTSFVNITFTENSSLIYVGGINELAGIDFYALGETYKYKFDPVTYDYEFTITYSDGSYVSSYYASSNIELTNQALDLGIAMWRSILSDAGLTYYDLGFTAMS